MLVSRMAVLCLGLLCSVSALAGVSEEQIRKYLPGTWQVSQMIQGVQVQGTSTYGADGRLAYEGALTIEGQVLPFKARGKWSVSGNQFRAEILESSLSDLMEPGTVEIDRVIAIDERTYVYEDDEGTRMTETRMGAR